MQGNSSGLRAARTAGLCLAACALLLAAAPAHAQRPAQPELRITVVDSATGDPVSNARVVLGGSAAALTDLSGTVVFAGLARGEHPVEVTQLGFQRHQGALRLENGGGAFTIRLAPRAIQLQEVAVTGPRRARSWMLDRFHRRVQNGSGAYITRAQIEQAAPRRTSELFRLVPGMSVASLPQGDGLAMMPENAARMEGNTGITSSTQRQECPILYFVDGTPVQVMGNGSIDQEILPSEIEGIEVYRRDTLAPAEFRRAGATCGIVLIWKRERH